MNRSAASTSRWGGAVQKAGRYATYAGLAIGGALVVGLTKATRGALEDEAAQARLAQAFKQSNVPIQNYAKAIDRAEAAGVQLGFADDAVIESLGSLVVATHSGRKAIDLLSVAEDIARFKHIDLAGASKMLTMAMAGSQRATKQLGLSLQPTTENVDALKRAAEENKTKVDSMALAQAKAADKMQTSQNVIALVTQKLKGQSEAFSETAAGGIERMNASLDRLGDTIGAALLPALTKVIDPLSKFFAYLAENPKLAEGLVIGIAALAGALLALSVAASAATSIGVLAGIFAAVSLPVAAVVVALVALTGAIAVAVLWPDKLQAALQRMGLSAEDSRKTVDALRNAFTTIRTVVQTVWPAIQAIVVPALRVIQGLLMIVSGILRGDFSDAWKGIKIVVANEIKLMLAVITAFPRIVLGVAKQIGAAILQGIGDGLRNLGAFVRGKLQALPGALADIASQIPGEAAKIGYAITAGIVTGLAGVFSAVYNWLKSQITSAVDKVKGIFEHSPQEAIGVELVEGVGRGVEKAGTSAISAPLTAKVSEAVRDAQEAVKNARADFASAWADLASAALSAFDSAMSTWKPKAQKILDAREYKKQTQDAAQAVTDASQQMATANAEMAKALAGGDPEQIQAARNAQLAAQKAYDDALYNQETLNLQRQAAQQQEAHDKAAEREKIALGKRYAAIEAAYNKELAALVKKHNAGEITDKQFHDRRIALQNEYSGKERAALNESMKKLGVDQKFWGTAAGISLAAGLNSAIARVAQAATRLANVLARLLKLKTKSSWDTEEGPMADFGHWWDNLAEGLVAGIDYQKIAAAGKGVAATFKGGVDSGVSAWGAGIDWTSVVFPGGVPEGLGQEIMDSIAGVNTNTTTPAIDALGGVGDSLGTVTESTEAFATAVEALPTRAQAAFNRLVELITKAVLPLPKILAPAALAFLAIADSILALGNASYQARNALRDTATEIARLLREIATAGAAYGTKPAGMATGGTVTVGTPYIVGEAGPELFIPSTSGRIAPSVSGGTPLGGTVVNVAVYGDVTGDEIVRKVREGLLRVDLYNPGNPVARPA